jgi:hypothetical protein
MGNRFVGASHLRGQTENGGQQTEPSSQKLMVSNAHEGGWVLVRAIILQ